MCSVGLCLKRYGCISNVHPVPSAECLMRRDKLNQYVGLYNKCHFALFMAYLVLTTSIYTILGFPPALIVTGFTLAIRPFPPPPASYFPPRQHNYVRVPLSALESSLTSSLSLHHDLRSLRRSLPGRRYHAHLAHVGGCPW